MKGPRVASSSRQMEMKAGKNSSGVGIEFMLPFSRGEQLVDGSTAISPRLI